MAEQMIIDSSAKDATRMLDIGPDEVWTPFFESINQLMLEEKKQRQDNDSFKGADVCCKIVSLTLQNCCYCCLFFDPFISRLNLVNNLLLNYLVASCLR